LTQDMCTMHPMKLLGDAGHVESHFSPFRDNVAISSFGDRGNLDAR
jgi:hypothetical protein